MEIRKAKRGDEVQIMELIHGLAAFENEPDEVDNTAELLGKDLFDDQVCEAFVAEEGEQIIGFGLFYTSYSTWKGPCLYLEDLYVRESHRRLGVGGLLFDRLVETAKERNFARMDWQVLDWNEPAIDFYKKKGARLDVEWLNGRLFFR